MKRHSAWGVCLCGIALVMGGCGLMREWDPATSRIAPDPVPAHPEKGPFLFSYFLGNGDGLHLASSTDGLAFTPIGGEKRIFLVPTVGVNIDGTTKDQHLMRDPCLRQGPDGIYHLVWTTGWYQHGIGVASSPDLVHWSKQQFVEVMKAEPTAANTWAPELFYDEAAKKWLIFWASTIPGRFAASDPPEKQGDRVTINGKSIGLNHRIYYVSTADFVNYSATRLLYDPGGNAIDATMARIPGFGGARYLMVLKDETLVPNAAKNLWTSTAERAEGPWGTATGPISPAGLWVEGPSIAQVGDAWYVYYDKYMKPQGYGAVRTKDFVKWEPVTQNLSFPAGARHGTVFPVTEAVVERLKKSLAAPW